MSGVATILAWPDEIAPASSPSDEQPGVVWQEPPAPKARPSEAAQLAEVVASRPGEWARVRTWPKAKLSNATSYARQIRLGAHAAYAQFGVYEAVARVVTVDDEEVSAVFLRLLGPKKEREPATAK